MKRKMWISGLIGLLLTGFATIAAAEVIYNQPLSETDNYGFTSNIDGTLSADNFAITDTLVVQSIEWYGMYLTSDPSNINDTFDIKIYDIAGTLLLFEELKIKNVNKSDSGFSDADGGPIYKYDTDIAGWELIAGQYLLSISNQNSVASEWFWADGLGGDEISYYWDDSGALIEDTDTGIDMAFSLSGTLKQPSPVPEPGTFLLVGLGLLAASFSRGAKESV